MMIQYHEGKSYTDFSLWDTFRAQNSLWSIVAPDKIDEMVQSLLQNYQEGGYMPKWPNPGYTNIMIGTHADSIVAEAINKGFDGFDYDLAYEAVLKVQWFLKKVMEQFINGAIELQTYHMKHALDYLLIKH